MAPLLAARGYRVIVPYLRGHGSTLFLSSRTFRNAQQAAIARDIIALMDALRIKKAIIGGFDWGSRTADIITALWPERCTALVSVSGYLITNRKANLEPLIPSADTRGGTSTISPQNEAGSASNSIARNSSGSSGRPSRRRGPSTTPRSSAPRRRSPIPTGCPSSSTTTDGD
ncbi:hypothetical protein Pth03_76360 [Planotetraspora thailandica]|uniref:AB hydrolase-1 domain-containing protein n=1 Tax=Planotetraspora thailandica TaxID=487172 RepID=A0A8J3Y1Y2_9ACTN|nr:hypothetical protein Pth03_76360 [Planotetraspora thailandica]